jgi:hypothetical protein
MGRRKESHSSGRAAAVTVDCGDACNFDWKDIRELDFGDPSKAYRDQAHHFRDEATAEYSGLTNAAPGIGRVLAEPFLGWWDSK